MHAPDTLPEAISCLFLAAGWVAFFFWFLGLSRTGGMRDMDSEFGTLSQRMASASTMLILTFLTIIFGRQLLGYTSPSTTEELYKLLLTTAAYSIVVVIVAHAAFVVRAVVNQRDEMKQESAERERQRKAS